jgi:hypothetical protein
MRAAIYLWFSSEADMENSEKDKMKNNVEWNSGRRNLHEKSIGIVYPSLNQRCRYGFQREGRKQ